jgi:hypothetical protein
MTHGVILKFSSDWGVGSGTLGSQRGVHWELRGESCSSSFLQTRHKAARRRCVGAAPDGPACWQVFRVAEVKCLKT